MINKKIIDDHTQPKVIATTQSAATYTPGISNVDYGAGVYRGGVKVKGDVNLVVGNIKSGTTILGVDGSMSTGAAAALTSSTGPVGCIPYGTPSDGSTIVINGLPTDGVKTFTKVASSPGANQFSTSTQLATLITTLTDLDATDYTTYVQWSVPIVSTFRAPINVMITGTGTYAGLPFSAGNATAGYYGKVNDLITGTALYTQTGTTGVGTSTVSGNKGVDTGDITWLKFSSNNKTLFVADRNIKYSMSWDQIQTAGCVKGKVITINGINYLCRLLQGADINPASAAGTVNDEWRHIVNFTPLEADSNWTSVYSLTQEVHSTGLSDRVVRGYGTVSDFGHYTSSIVDPGGGWRPVLEVL